MRTFARIQDGRVAELFGTDVDIRHLFHPSLLWVDVTAEKAVGVGWAFDGKSFTPPVAVPRPVLAGVTVAELQRQLAVLSGQLEALAGH